MRNAERKKAQMQKKNPARKRDSHYAKHSARIMFTSRAIFKILDDRPF